MQASLFKANMSTYNSQASPFKTNMSPYNLQSSPYKANMMNYNNLMPGSPYQASPYKNMSN